MEAQDAIVAKPENLTDLPHEVILHILSFLAPKDLLGVALVNDFFKRLANDPKLWEARVNQLIAKPTPKSRFFSLSSGMDLIPDKLLQLLMVECEAWEDSREFQLDFDTVVDERTVVEIYYRRAFRKILSNYNPVLVVKELIKLLKRKEVEPAYSSDEEEEDQDEVDYQWKTYFQEKYRINVEDEINVTGYFNQSFLHFFSTTLNVDAIRLLIEEGGSMGDRDGYGITPLHLIFMSGPPDESLLSYLISIKANFDIEEPNPETDNEEEEEEEKPANFIMTYCLEKGIFRTKYLEALAFLIRNNAFSNSLEIQEHCLEVLKGRYKADFIQYLEKKSSLSLS